LQSLILISVYLFFTLSRIYWKRRSTQQQQQQQLQQQQQPFTHVHKNIEDKKTEIKQVKGELK
jgi:hypothetical protein